MLKIERNLNDLKNQLKEQYLFLSKSCSDFDKGETMEAKRIALALRILLYDKSSSGSNSLLGQLSQKEKILFLNSCHPFCANNLMPHIGLVYLTAVNTGQGFKCDYKPLLGDYLKLGNQEDWQEFHVWWEGLVIKDQCKNSFTRKSLILHVADTDGGAHIDGKIKKEYAELSRENSIGWTFESQIDGKIESKPINGIELASVRQIGYEVQLSIKKYFSFS